MDQPAQLAAKVQAHGHRLEIHQAVSFWASFLLKLHKEVKFHFKLQPSETPCSSVSARGEVCGSSVVFLTLGVELKGEASAIASE